MGRRYRLNARKIRRLREAKGVTQAQLAALADVSERTILALEQGEYEPRVSTLFKITEALGLGRDFSKILAPVPSVPDAQRRGKPK